MSRPEARETSLYDPGLQLERTHLAWRRTALGFIANAALVLRLAPATHAVTARDTIAAALALIGISAWWHSHRAYVPRGAGLLQGEPTLRPRSMRLLALATASVAFVAMLTALTTLL